MLRAFAVCTALTIAGCQSMPGFQFGFQFHLPPTLRQDQTLTPVPAATSTIYATDVHPPAPALQRQYQIAPGYAPVPTGPAAPPARQLLPMPRETPPPSPCGQVSRLDVE